jgi:hypothetical protein
MLMQKTGKKLFFQNLEILNLKKKQNNLIIMTKIFCQQLNN